MSFSALVALSSTILADESIDTRENADLTLKCRFNDKYESNDFSFFWTRWTANPAQFDNVAIGDVQLSSGYRWVIVIAINIIDSFLLTFKFKVASSC